MIYADCAATTPMTEKAKKAWNDVVQENWGNPSSPYRYGQQARKIVEEAKEKIAAWIGAEPNEIFFTSGATESNNWISVTPSLIFTSPIEHPSVLNMRRGLGVVQSFRVGSDGVLQLPTAEEWDIMQDAADRMGGVVSIMLANNETGILQPVKMIADEAHRRGMGVHTDATAALGHIPVNVGDLGVDMLSGSAHKFGGPKGVGFLYVLGGEKEPFMCGGAQQNGARAGTLDVASIAAMAAAIDPSEQEKRAMRAIATRRAIEDALLQIPGASLNGTNDDKMRLPGTLSIRFDGVEAAVLIGLLDIDGIFVSGGSACHGNGTEPSYVLKAMGLSDDQARATIRISINDGFTKETIDALVGCIKSCVEHCRGESK